MILCKFLKYIYLTYDETSHSGSAVKNPPAMLEIHEMRVRSLGWEDPLEEGAATHSNILA